MTTNRAAAAHDQDRSPRTRQPERVSRAAAPRGHAPATLAAQRTVADPTTARPAEILALQKTYGNRAVSGLLGGQMQAKLMVGPAGDAYEQEADRVAAQVMRMPAPRPPSPRPAVGRLAGAYEPDIQAQPLAATITPLAQRAAGPAAPARGDDPGAGFEAGTDVESRLSTQQGTGQSLSGEVRAFMEPRFGADFSGVRVHTGTEASQLNRQLSAQAFTHGQDIYMGEGKYNPGSTDGRHLLAHELTHVVQQTGGGAAAQTKLQRKIGFEFEMNHWATWQAVPADAVDDQTEIKTRAAQSREEYREAVRAEDENRSKWKRLPKGAIMVENGNLELTADDWGNGSDLELRSKAMDETDAGTVAATAGLVGDSLDEMGVEMRAAARAYHQLRARDLTGVIKRPETFLTTVNPDKKTGKPQITTGVRLEALPSLIRNMFPDPDETAEERGRRAEGRLKGTGFNQDTQEAGPLLTIMGNAPGKAERALASYLAKHKHAPTPASDKLKGLTALLIAYLDMGKSGLVRSYAKTIAPIMARTDFATMFTMLPTTERDYYAGDSGGKFVDLLKEAGYSWYAMRGSIYSGGITESQEPSQWYLDLKRKDWLKSMTSKSTVETGTDKLTPANYPTAQGKAQIEGLGSYADRTDTVNTGAGPIDVPILELRSLPTMEPDVFADMVVKVARLVAYLNEGTDKTLGEA